MENLKKNSAPLRIFMIEAREKKKIVYVLAQYIYKSLENRQLLIPTFSICSFEKPQKGIYIEYHINLKEGERYCSIHYIDSRIYNFNFKIIKKEDYQDYANVSSIISYDERFETNTELIKVEQNNKVSDVQIWQSMTLPDLNNELDEAVANEDYPRAAEIRDEIARR